MTVGRTWPATHHLYSRRRWWIGATDAFLQHICVMRSAKIVIDDRGRRLSFILSFFAYVLFFPFHLIFFVDAVVITSSHNGDDDVIMQVTTQ